MTDFRYYQFEDFLLDTEEGLLFRNGEPIPLPRKVFDLLTVFVRSEGRVLTRDEIIQTIWADTTVEQSNLKQSIYVLRRALGESPDENRFIKTLPKRGYRFLAEVKVLPDGNENLTVAEYHDQAADVFIEEEIIEDEANEAESRAPTLSNRGYRIWQQPLFIGLLCLIVFLTVGYGIYRYANSTNAASSPISLENASWQKLTNTGNPHFAAISRSGDFVAYVALGENSEQSIRVLNIGNRSEMTIVPPAQIEIWGASFSPDGSQIYYTAKERNRESKAGTLYAVSVFGGAGRKILEPINSPISFSADETRLVYTRKSDDSKTLLLITANVADGGEQQIVAKTEKNEFISPIFSPDGKRIVYIAGENREDGWYWHLSEIPATGGEAKIVTQPRKGRFFGANWFPDGKGILLSASAPESRLQQLWYVSYPNGEISRITNDLTAYNFAAISGDGKKIVSVQLTRTNSVWSSPFAESVPRRLTEDTLLIQSLAWTPDNRIIFDSVDNNRAHLWIMNSDGANKRQISPENIEDYRPAVSPDGRFLIFLSNRSGAWQVWRSNLDGSEPRQLTLGKSTPHLAKFAFGGEKIIVECFFNNQWRLAQTSIEGGELTPITDVEPGVWGVSPDGKTIAYSFFDSAQNRQRVAVYPLEDKSQIAYLEIAPRDFLVFTTDGKALLTKPPPTVSDSISSIYSYPIDGGNPKKIVSNPPENFYSLDLSPDGNRLAWVQGKLDSNVVLLTRR